MMTRDQNGQLDKGPREERIMRSHCYAVGQRVCYSENHSPKDFWMGGYEIVALVPAGNREPQYQIRSADQKYDRVVWEARLQEDIARGDCAVE